MVFKNAGNRVDAADFNRDVEYVYFFTAFECVSTGVEFTRAELVTANVLTSATLSATNNIVIDGTDYILDATYDNALWTNLNWLRMSRVVRENSTVISTSNENVVGSGVALDDIRLAGGTAAGEFGTALDNTAEGFWLNVFVVESTDTLATAADAPNGVAAITAETALTTDMTNATGDFFSTTAATENNTDSETGDPGLGGGVDGRVSATVGNFIVRVSDTPLG